MNDAPLILTAKMDDESFQFFDALRRAHFPSERNFLAAHITMFHHLPGNLIGEIKDYLMLIAAENTEFPAMFPSVRFLGKGSAADVMSPKLLSLRRILAARWDEFLTNQDRQKFNPHITIQNKVAPDEAKMLFTEIQNKWQLRSGTIEGLQLWHYRGGPWELAHVFDFQKNI